jgi:hypothetical protein
MQGDIRLVSCPFGNRRWGNCMQEMPLIGQRWRGRFYFWFRGSCTIMPQGRYYRRAQSRSDEVGVVAFLASRQSHYFRMSGLIGHDC